MRSLAFVAILDNLSTYSDLSVSKSNSSLESLYVSNLVVSVNDVTSKFLNILTFASTAAVLTLANVDSFAILDNLSTYSDLSVSKSNSSLESLYVSNLVVSVNDVTSKFLNILTFALTAAFLTVSILDFSAILDNFFTYSALVAVLSDFNSTSESK